MVPATTMGAVFAAPIPATTAIPSRRQVRCAAASSQTSNVAGGNPMLSFAVEALFKFPPVFKLAAKGAREKIINRGKELGLDFAAEIEALRQVDWSSEMAQVTDSTVPTPDYYKVPFHAYEKGNLSMEAALEVTVASKSVHATGNLIYQSI